MVPKRCAAVRCCNVEIHCSKIITPENVGSRPGQPNLLSEPEPQSPVDYSGIERNNDRAIEEARRRCGQVDLACILRFAMKNAKTHKIIIWSVTV